MLSGLIYSDIPCVILFGIYSDILSGTLCGLLSEIYLDILSGIFYIGILFGNLSSILRAFCSGSIQAAIYSGILSCNLSFRHSIWHALWHVFGSKRSPQHPQLTIPGSGPGVANCLQRSQYCLDRFMLAAAMGFHSSSCIFA